MAGVLDARLSIGFATHPKTKRLIRRLGHGAGWELVCLILWTAANKPDGDLGGMTDEDIEIAAGYEGEAGKFVAELVNVKFLDGATGDYRLHDWTEHQPWASGAEARSEKGRFAGLCKQYGRHEAERQMPEYAARVRARDAGGQPPAQLPAQQEARNGQPLAIPVGEPVASHMPPLAVPLPTTGTAPYPIPSPSPSPIPTLNTPHTPQGGQPDAKPLLPGADDPMFVQFYEQAYPRKTGRQDAWRAWKALHVTAALFAEIMAGLEMWKLNPRWTKDNGQFIKTPGPWLRQKLWTDEEVCGPGRQRATASAGHEEVCL